MNDISDSITEEDFNGNVLKNNAMFINELFFEKPT